MYVVSSGPFGLLFTIINHTHSSRYTARCRTDNTIPVSSLMENKDCKDWPQDLFEDLTRNQDQAHWTVVGNVFKAPLFKC